MPNEAAATTSDSEQPVEAAGEQPVEEPGEVPTSHGASREKNHNRVAPAAAAY
jgi:hypothetical protein